MTTHLPIGTKILAGSFLTSGIVHLVQPDAFEPLMPRGLPAHREIIYASGVAEIVCGVGLLTRQRWAPLASATLLLAVWVGNWEYAIKVQRSARTSTPHKVGAWLRVPIQVPMIRVALKSRPATT
ncbi:MAG: DoxX family protein [Actinomycetota bacterium]|nr:DoxX family protein [Actinomycetota bacterium]